MELAGKRVAILGGGSGIGREIALRAASGGARVAIGDLDLAAAQSSAALCRQAGVEAHALPCDLGDDDSVANFADEAERALRGVDIVFNHAGVSLAGLLEHISPEDWMWMLNVNLGGLARSVRAFVPKLTACGGGWIVNTSSGLGLFHDVPVAAPYAASKAAIIAYSRSLAVYLRNRRIGVTVFCPDLTRTGFVTGGRLVGIPPELAAAGLSFDTMQEPGEAVKVLFEGLAHEAFLVSAVPRTAERLAAMAEGYLAPGADAVGHGPLVQRGQVQVPEAGMERALAAFEAFAAASRTHWGCRDYHFSRSASRPDVIEVFEVFDSQAALDAHSGAPETLAFLQIMLELGAHDFRTHRVRV